MPPKPGIKKGDDDYVPSEEEVSEEAEEEQVVEGIVKEKTKKPKKSKKEEDYSSVPTEEETAKTKKPKGSGSRKKGDDVYKPDSESEDEDEDEDDSETETAAKSSSSPGKSKVDDEKKVRNPTKKAIQKGEEKKLDEDKLTPPPVKKSKKKKDKVKATDNDKELDDLLASFPLPSSSRPSIFNKNIAMIGALNIQAFGTTKASNSVIMKIICDILRHYDIILCQEIRASDEIIRQLTDLVSTPATPFDYVASRSIGRSTYQEKYLFLYRKNEWKVLENYVVDDDKMGDKFIREPYVVRFQHLRKTDVRITLVGCHTQPENAFEEIKTLVSTVYTDVKEKLKRDNVQEKRQLDRGTGKEEKRLTGLRSFLWNYFCCCFGSYSPVSTRDFTEEASLAEDGTANEPIIIMGDLNASGSYVNKTRRVELDTILKEFNLVWGIQHNLDTTVSDGSDAAYDRFIFEAAKERRWIGKTGIWRFDEGWQKGKDDIELIKKAARRVTDHYPIEFELKLKL